MSTDRRDSGSGDSGRDSRRSSPRGTPPRRNLPVQPGRPFRQLAFWVFVILLAVAGYRMYQGSLMAPQRAEVSFTRFIQEVEKGNIQDLQIVERSVTGDLKVESSHKVDGHDQSFKSFKANIVGDGAELPALVWKTNPGVEIEVRSAGFSWAMMLLQWLPLILIFGAWMFVLRQMQSGGSAALKFGKTKARVLLESNPKITFKDVAGCDEAKQELQEIIEFLKEPQKFQKLGARIPKGALLLGPPGTGKTLLAKAVAGEAGVPFFSMSGSDFVEMFVGVGASRVRDLFEQGKRNAPCITGDSVVTLSGGKQVTIGEMFDKKMVGVKVPAMTDDFRFEDATVLGITRKPSKELFTITTATSEIRATGNHLFPVMRGEAMKWVPAEELTTSDYVAAPRVIASASEPNFYDCPSGPTPSYVGSYQRELVAPSRASMQAAVMEMDETRESAVLWSRVTKIAKNVSDEPVYDLCLNRVNCFVANNLVVHNCILFIDEIDAVGRHRGAGLGGGHDEREQTLNQLLVEMDGFESNDGVIIVAATNRPDVLDPALMRPGRFDRQIVVDWPDVRGREGILAVHATKRPLADDVNLPLLARSTPGMSGADLENLVNEAALLAARRNRKKVTMADFEDAKDKVMLGTERRSLVMTDAELKTTAYHEAGHALVAWLLPDADPVTKITIVPRGRALGVTAYAPTEERHNNSKKQLEDRLSYAMGGRAAELLIFSHLTTGAVSDLEQATGIARAMVTRFGMSDKLGPLSFGKRDEMVFLGREMTSSKDYSEETAVLIDSEVRVIIEAAHANAVRLLTENLDKLHLLAKTLLERETLDGDEMVRLLKGETLPPIKTEEPPSESAPPAVQAVVEPQTGMGGLGALPPPAPRPAGA